MWDRGRLFVLRYSYLAGRERDGVREREMTREREGREILHLLVHTPDDHNRQWSELSQAKA